jgi:hypothetical protein
MNFNRVVLNKIENFIALSREFDLNYKHVMSMQNNNIKNEDIKYIYMITKYFIELRTVHGELLLLVDELKKCLNSSNCKTSNKIDKLYDLSTFTSILSNVNELITNIDYQYKKIAIKYPKFITKKQLRVFLITNDDDENNLYVKFINDV